MSVGHRWRVDNTARPSQQAQLTAMCPLRPEWLLFAPSRSSTVKRSTTRSDSPGDPVRPRSNAREPERRIHARCLARG